MMENLLAKHACGIVRKETFFSPALGVKKNYHIYLPPGYEEERRRRYPVLYLFRGHENEWFDPYQDHSRGGVAIQHLADEMIAAGMIGPMIIVGPSTTSDDGQIYGLGVNFVNPAAARGRSGIGQGQFEDYLVRDLVGHIDANYRTRARRKGRGLDGFSLGGFTSVMLAVKHPQLFCSSGSYDGSHMFFDMSDPRRPAEGPNDRLWMRDDAMFAAAFRRKNKRRYDAGHMLFYNPLNIISNCTPEELRQIRTTRFYITTAAFDGMQGNRDRGVHLMTVLQQFRIRNTARGMILSSDAHHTWKFADLHMRKTLRLHSAAFGQKPLPNGRRREKRRSTQVEIIAIMPPRWGEHSVRFHFRVYQEIPCRLEILSRQGEPIRWAAEQVYGAGRHSIEWSGNNNHNHPVSSGVYFLQITTPGGTVRESFAFLRR